MYFRGPERHGLKGKLSTLSGVYKSGLLTPPGGGKSIYSLSKFFLSIFSIAAWRKSNWRGYLSKYIISVNCDKYQHFNLKLLGTAFVKIISVLLESTHTAEAQDLQLQLYGQRGDKRGNGDQSIKKAQCELLPLAYFIISTLTSHCFGCVTRQTINEQLSSVGNWARAILHLTKWVHMASHKHCAEGGRCDASTRDSWRKSSTFLGRAFIPSFWQRAGWGDQFCSHNKIHLPAYLKLTNLKHCVSLLICIKTEEKTKVMYHAVS